MSRKLTAYVEVDGDWYGPGSRVPAEVAARITNPDVWDSPVDTVEVSEPEIKEPPRGGPGSSAEAWRIFATSQGLDTPDGASARDIQALWDARDEG